MNGVKLIDWISFLVAGITLILGFVLFFNDTNEFLSSLFAAVLAAALMWVAYILVRLLVLAFK